MRIEMLLDNISKLLKKGESPEGQLCGDNWAKQPQPENNDKMVNAIIRRIDKGKEVIMYEVCDCGNQIRHNNGGNYHGILIAKKQGGKYICELDDTCELTEAEAYKVSIDELRKKISYALSEDWAIGWL